MTLTAARKSVVTLLALTVMAAGCKSAPSAAAEGANTAPQPSGNYAVSAAAPAQSSAGAPAAAPTQLKSSIPTYTSAAMVSDPSFNNMPAESITIPAGWKLEGTMMTSPCTTLPWQVFRSYAADGLTEMRQLPAFGWKWATNPQGVNFNGCMQYNGTLTAADFLNHYVQTLTGGVHVVGPSPIAPAFSQWAQHFADQLNTNAQQITYAPAKPYYTADTASLRIETHNGTFTIEQRLRVAVECTLYKNPGPLQGGTCFARIDILRAPQGSLDKLIQFVDRNGLPIATPTPQYGQAVMARTQQQGHDAIVAMNQLQQQQSATLRQMNTQFMATMQSNHAAWQQQQDAQYQSFQGRMAAQSQTQSNIASDWVDVALDQHTVTGSGGTQKVSNAYGTTWSNGQGVNFQTNDPNANPNGTLSGTWTQQQVVHGNGQPY